MKEYTPIRGSKERVTRPQSRGFIRTLLAGAAALVCLLPPMVRMATAETHNEFSLDGAQEVPACATPASGSAVVTLRERKVTVSLHWKDLSGPPTRIDIHGPAGRGNRAPVLFRLAMGRRGSASDSAEVTLEIPQKRKKIFRDELAYLNIRTAKHPLGEIRGQIVPTDEEADEDD